MHRISNEEYVELDSLFGPLQWSACIGIINNARMESALLRGESKGGLAFPLRILLTMQQQ